MSEMYDRIQEATRAIQSKWSSQPTAGIILGTGLGGLTEELSVEATIPYDQIPHFPQSTSPSHRGQLVCGTLSGKSVVVMERRFHCYEG